jgi:WD40 repeat protein
MSRLRTMHLRSPYLVVQRVLYYHLCSIVRQEAKRSTVNFIFFSLHHLYEHNDKIWSQFSRVNKVHDLADKVAIPSRMDAKKPVNILAVHPSKHLLVSGHSDGSVRMWEYQAQKIINTFDGNLIHCYYFNSSTSPKTKCLIVILKF